MKKKELEISKPIARSISKMNFHANASLTAINIAKSIYYLPFEKSERKAFSMADIKTENHNLFLFDFILYNLDLKPKSKKISILRQKVRDIGKIAA